MKVAGLFAGIGGFEVGLNRSGHSTILTCENDTSAVSVLCARLGMPNHDDICTLRSLPSEAEIVAAGFPCQDLSQAGATAGISGGRSGLIMEVFRLVRAHRTPWVLIENVPFALRLHRGAALDLYKKIRPKSSSSMTPRRPRRKLGFSNLLTGFPGQRAPAA